MPPSFKKIVFALLTVLVGIISFLIPKWIGGVESKVADLTGEYREHVKDETSNQVSISSRLATLEESAKSTGKSLDKIDSKLDSMIESTSQMNTLLKTKKQEPELKPYTADSE